MELTLEQWKKIKAHCDDVGVQFISSPFSCAAVDLLEQTGITTYKLGSGEINNHLLLQKVIATGKPLILSSGMSSLAELDDAVAKCKAAGTQVSVLQCTTAYPTQPHQWGLHIISTLKNRYKLPTGFSDHSGDVAACLAATALGAEILEFHAVFDRRMFGPDAKASLEINEVKQLVDGVRKIRIALAAGDTKDEQVQPLTGLKQMFGISLCINKDLPQGHVLTLEDLETKKPAGFGIPPSEYQAVIGKKLVNAGKRWAFLKTNDIR